jgi:hypothetical protein
MKSNVFNKTYTLYPPKMARLAEWTRIMVLNGEVAFPVVITLELVVVVVVVVVDVVVVVVVLVLVLG